jgi:peptidoglycan/LPS O-acetylase OafA/YrhL
VIPSSSASNRQSLVPPPAGGRSSELIPEEVSLPATVKTKPTFSAGLQSLRGLAALTVLLGHCLSVFQIPSGSVARALNALLNGGGAVTFFFALSGSVLALSLRRERFSLRSYGGFCVKRALRILPMVFVAVIIGTIYCNRIDVKATYPFATEWFTKIYKLNVDGPRFIGALIGYSARPAPPLWSIFVELIGSVLLPFFVLSIRNYRWMFGMMGVLLLVSFANLSAFQYYWPVFLIDFFAGVTILVWGPGFAAATLRWGWWVPRIVAAVCVAVVLLNREYFWIPSEHGDPVTNLIELSAVCPVIALILYIPDGFGLLRAKPLIFLGDVSYSLYVLHFPILCFFVQIMAWVFHPETIALHKAVFIVLTMILVAGSSLLVSAQTYRLIELPFAALGKRLAAQLFGAPRAQP